MLIMKSSGGVIGMETAVRQPVYTALSGPAAGVMAARHFGQMTGFKDVISLDMGGHQYRRVPDIGSQCHVDH